MDSIRPWAGLKKSFKSLNHIQPEPRTDPLAPDPSIGEVDMESNRTAPRTPQVFETVECNVCSIWIRAFETLPPHEYVVETELYPRSVRDAAENGCPICSAFTELYRPIMSFERGNTLKVFQHREVKADHHRRTYFSLHMDSDVPYLSSDIFCSADLPDPWGIFPIEGEIITGSGPDSCHRVAAKWIRRCVTTHSCCRTGADQPLPSRLVEIDKHLRNLKVVETKGKTGRYMCLSHCWGTKHTFETTAETLPRFLKGFPYTDMPTVYREAVKMAHMMGVKYLWIDSLCIVQDDRDDWLREAGQMANIYANCFLTIAATRAKSNTTTMHHDRKDKEALGITPVVGNPYRLLSHIDPSHPGVKMRYGEDEQFPLLTRGWVFQERLLSPRVLHFGADELLWECHEEFLCECESSRGLGLSKAGYTRLLADGNRDELEESWRRLVEQYSAMQLTNASDKLPAFSGIAKQFAEKQPGSTYLAGLWSLSLLDDMLWYCNEFTHKQLNAKVEPRQAPSWSWVSVDQRVYYPSSEYYGNPKIEVVAHYTFLHQGECTPAGSDAMGEVKGGKLTMSGPVLRGHYCPRLRHDDHEYDLFIILTAGGGGETEMLFSTESLEPHPGSVVGRSRRNQLFLDYRDTRPLYLQPKRTEVICLRMAQMLRRNQFDLEAVEHILVLTKAERQAERQAGCYERIGMAIIRKVFYRDFGDHPPEGEDRYKPIDFTAEEEAELWSDFLSPFDGGDDVEAIVIV
ncbi:heterokaryon incompatibility protein-domain-containing protein [Podospora appendiculata]|uniref:Heterokaryon incompatibility protein-domain-containing protein n=1 Tax=Podospora appendiculata TaxID=314037 RepID=A0AAE1CEE9_9PEZI|nr:heterokaryon incompatibility protein-domain-containing protein [Podospora appendiculata]